MVHVSAPENRSVKTTQHDILPAWLLETDCYSEIWAFQTYKDSFSLSNAVHHFLSQLTAICDIASMVCEILNDFY